MQQTDYDISKITHTDGRLCLSNVHIDEITLFPRPESTMSYLSIPDEQFNERDNFELKNFDDFDNKFKDLPQEFTFDV